MTLARRLPSLATAALVALTLLSCSAQLAYAQVRGVQFQDPVGLAGWNSVLDRVCLAGVAEGGVAYIAGFSADSACDHRIALAERLPNRQCEADVCARLWRVTFDAGGVLMIWAREDAIAQAWLEASAAHEKVREAVRPPERWLGVVVGNLEGCKGCHECRRSQCVSVSPQALSQLATHALEFGSGRQRPSVREYDARANLGDVHAANLIDTRRWHLAFDPLGWA